MTTTRVLQGNLKAKMLRMASAKTWVRGWLKKNGSWRSALSGPYAQFAWVAVANAHPAAPYSR